MLDPLFHELWAMIDIKDVCETYEESKDVQDGQLEFLVDIDHLVEDNVSHREDEKA